MCNCQGSNLLGLLRAIWTDDKALDLFVVMCAMLTDGKASDIGVLFFVISTDNKELNLFDVCVQF